MEGYSVVMIEMFSFDLAFRDFLAVFAVDFLYSCNLIFKKASVDEPVGSSGSNCYLVFLLTSLFILLLESRARIVLLTD